MHTVTYTQHSCTVREHRLDVPLDPTGGDFKGRKIEVFAREIVAPGGEDLPMLVFLQGGPGGAGPRVGDFREGWTGAALDRYRVLLLDQRGTGQSSPLTADVIAGEERPADFLALFTQNQILADAEAFRAEILGEEKWATLGQSYGGFLTLGYLSQYPDAIRESFITGGLVGLTSIDEIYRRTYPLTARRNRQYFRRYAEDQSTIRQVAAHLAGHDERLPTGERLSPTRMRSLGLALGGAMRFDTLHYLWEGPFVHRDGEKRLSQTFLAEVGAALSSGAAPLYWPLQEAIYGQTTADTTGRGTRWAAERLSGEFEGFALDADPLDTSAPYYLTAEHTFRELISEDPATSAFLPAVDELAERTDWPVTYDEDVLAQVDVPVTALVYYDDIYVPRALSERTAAILPRARTWVTNSLQHDGLRADGTRVFNTLWDLSRD